VQSDSKQSGWREMQQQGSGKMQVNKEFPSLPVRANLIDFALLIGGALATACAVAVVAMGVVLLLAR